jgi:hypothetical protein
MLYLRKSGLIGENNMLENKTIEKLIEKESNPLKRAAFQELLERRLAQKPVIIIEDSLCKNCDIDYPSCNKCIGS